MEVETGRGILYKVCSDGKRNIQRKGEDKKKKCIKDVIKLLKEVDPDCLPTFVARDLGRLPPVSFDHVDVSRLMKDIICMKTELAELKTQFCSDLKEIRLSVSQTHKDSFEKTATPKTTKCPSTLKTPPLIAVPTPACTQPRVADIVHTPSYRDIVSDTARPRHTKHARLQRGSTGQSGVTAAAAATMTTLNERPIHEKSFTLVTNKKRKTKNMRGTSEAQCKIQVADSHSSIYVSRAKKSVTVNDIQEHIADRGEECVRVELLKQNNETAFNSFKITIPTAKLETFLDGKFWPSGLVFRRYRERHINTAFKTTKYDSTPNK